MTDEEFEAIADGGVPPFNRSGREASRRQSLVVAPVVTDDGPLGAG